MSAVQLEVWDTAGQERFRAMSPMYYRGANGCIVVYDITSHESFEAAKTWIKELKKFRVDGVAIVIAGNKTDLESQREVDHNEAEMYAKQIGVQHISVSAKTGENINELFKITAEGILTYKSNVGNRFKVILLGATSVGKSSINTRWTSNRFSEYQESTIGAAFTTKSLQVSGSLNPGTSSISSIPSRSASFRAPTRSTSAGLGFGISNVIGRSKKQTANTIGLSMGGAKDVGNFRDCIQQNRMPPLDSITFPGLLYEYQFDTSTVRHLNQNDNEQVVVEGDDEKHEDGSRLFYPTYCYAKVKKMDFGAADNVTTVDDESYPTPKIESQRDEYYMTVGLNSNIKQDEFKRKHLNLVVVLDKSGSMSDSFDTFTFATRETKMRIANECVVALMKHLTANDRFGVVIFNECAVSLHALQSVDAIQMNELEQKILKIHPGGGTNLESGYNAAIDLFADVKSDEAYENRIIFLTDAQPTVGNTDPYSLLGLVSSNALNVRKRIYTTVIGVGLDFNSTLVQRITKTRGCNYYTVASKQAFVQRMDVEFEYMVTPLVFNVVLKLKCEGNSCKIDKVYGSNDDDIIKNGEITKIDTLFPSKRDAETGEVQGGIVLVKLKKTDKNETSNINVTVEVTFEDRNGKSFKNEQNVMFENREIQPKMEDMIEYEDEEDTDLTGNYYDNNGIRKGILLCAYVEILKDWMRFEAQRGSKGLRVNAKYKQIFINFLEYFKSEMAVCKDKKLKKEMDILSKLIQQNDEENNEQNDASSMSSYLYSMFAGLKRSWYG